MVESAKIKLQGQSDDEYIDIYTEYGVSFLKGSYIELLKRSSSKGYVKNESRLQHGTRMVAKAKYAHYTEKKFSVSIIMEACCMQHFVERFEGFQDLISQGLFYLKIPSRYRVFKLVYSDLKVKQEYRNEKAIFTLELIEPNPYDREILLF